MTERWSIHHGDVLDRLPELEAESFDAVLCDPPYGLEFMGMGWDKLTSHVGNPNLNKHGGSAPKHGQIGVKYGAPKRNPWCRSCGKYKFAPNASKCHCKAPRWNTRQDESGRQMQATFTEWWEAVYPALKPGAHLLAFGGTRTEHRLVCAIEDAGFEIRDKVMYLYGVGFPKSHNLDGVFKGYGTALKPAYEPCVVAMKPLDGTFAANAAAHGVAGLWIDGGRVGTDDTRCWHNTKGVWDSSETRRMNGSACGRWPANLILDAEAAAMLDAQSGVRKDGVAVNRNRNGTRKPSPVSIAPARVAASDIGYGGSGGASRFFYTAKASTRERNAGLEDLPDRDKYGPAGKWNSHDCFSGKSGDPAWRAKNPNLPKKNHHPTLKPIDLCRYLATLILPPKRDTPRRLLVPFSGSGSEMIGALLAGWDEVVGIEREREYIDIAERRLAHWCASSEEDATTLFAESA